MALYLEIGASLRSPHGKEEVSGSSPDVGLDLFGFTEPNVSGLENQGPDWGSFVALGFWLAGFGQQLPLTGLVRRGGVSRVSRETATSSRR